MGLYAIDCVRCKKPFMWFSGNTHNQACHECNNRLLVNGSKVIVIGDTTNTVRTVVEYNEDLCGDGCCSGYRLEGDESVFYWRGQLCPMD